MKIQKYLLTFALTPFLLVQTCAKDSEETFNDESEFTVIRYGKHETVTKAMAIEDWELFLKQSQEAIDNAETNIGNLETKIDEAEEYQKIQWQETCDSSNSLLIRLKAKRNRRNKEFEKELSAYDRSVYDKNEAFEIAFNNEMAAISSKLMSLFEKMRSGYYK
jgi:hypothetical protein